MSKMYPGSVPTEEPHHAGSLAPTSASIYCPSESRKRVDNVCTALFLLFMSFSVLAGFAMISQGTKASKDVAMRTPQFYNESMTCNAPAYDAEYYKLYPDGKPMNMSTVWQPDNDARLGVACVIWIPITVIIGIPASLLYLYLFKRWPLLMVKMSLYGTLAVLTLMTVLTFATGAWPLGLILIIFTVVLGVLMFFVRKQIPLCAELLGVASHALMDNLRIISTSLAISVCSLGILIFLFFCIVFATATGTVQYNYLAVKRVPSPGSTEMGYCYDVNGFSTPCCTWVVDTFPAVYVLFNVITVLWTAFLVMQIKLHCVADMIAQWYYQPVGQFTNAAEAPSMGRAVKHALTTGFGTNVFAAAILAILAMIRRALRSEGQRNLCCAVINCFAQPILALMEKFTKFATISAAITGKPFVAAARDIFEALKRCLFRTDSVWWVPDLVIGVVVWVMSLVWCALPFIAVGAKSKDWGTAFAVALFCFIMMVVIINFTAGILMDIVNTLYCLFALDRDAKVVTKPAIHAIFNQVIAVTSPGALIQNPGGDLAYGRAEEGQAPPPQYPPQYPAQYPPQYPPQYPAGTSMQMTTPQQQYYHQERDTVPLMAQQQQQPQQLYAGQQQQQPQYPPQAPQYSGYPSSSAKY